MADDTKVIVEINFDISKIEDQLRDIDTSVNKVNTGITANSRTIQNAVLQVRDSVSTCMYAIVDVIGEKYDSWMGEYSKAQTEDFVTNIGNNAYNSIFALFLEAIKILGHADGTGSSGPPLLLPPGNSTGAGNDKGSSTTGIVSEALSSMGGGLDEVMSLGTSLDGLVANTAAWVSNTAAKVANTAAGWAQIAATTAWNAICTAATAVTTAFGAAMTFLTSPIGLVLVAVAALIAIVVLLVKNWDAVKAAAVNTWNAIVGAFTVAASWMYTNVIEPVTNFFTSLWNTVSAAAVAAWNAIVGAFAAAGSWVQTNVVTPIVNFFTGLWNTVSAAAVAAWNGIKNAFGNAWKWFKDTLLDPLVNGFKGMVNGVIGFINGLIAGAVKGINGIINVLNKLKFTVPDWVPGLGGATIGFNLKTVTAPQIPYLAKGAVLPANRPFLAMVGDQRHGTNIEAPLATIQEAMALTMEDFVASNMAGHEATVGVLREILGAVLGIHIGDAVIAQAAERYRSKMAVVRGGSY